MNNSTNDTIALDVINNAFGRQNTNIPINVADIKHNDTLSTQSTLGSPLRELDVLQQPRDTEFADIKTLPPFPFADHNNVTVRSSSLQPMIKSQATIELPPVTSNMPFLDIIKLNANHMLSVSLSNFYNFMFLVIIILFVLSVIIMPIVYAVYKVEGFEFPSDSLSYPPRKQGPVQACTKFGMRRPDLVRAGKWCGKSVENISEVDSMLSGEMNKLDDKYVYDVADSNANILDVLPSPPLITDSNVPVKVNDADGSIDIESSINNIGSVQEERKAESKQVMSTNESFDHVLGSMSYPTAHPIGNGRINKERLTVGLDRTIDKNQSRYDPALFNPGSIIYTPSEETETFRTPNNRSIVESRRPKRK